MTGLDILVLGTTAFLVVRAFLRGLTASAVDLVLTILLVVGGLLVGARAISGPQSAGIATAALLALALMIGAILRRLTVFGGEKPHSLVSRTLGALIALPMSLFVAAAPFLFLTAGAPSLADDVKSARTYPLLSSVSDRLAGLAPDGSKVASMAWPSPAAPVPDNRARSDARPRPVAWTVVEDFANQEIRPLSGTIRAAERATMSFEVTGVLASVAVDLGDRFARGDVLAILDDRTFDLALAERRADLAQARATLREAQADYERNRQLAGTGAISEADLDQKRRAFETARSQVDRLTASVAIAEENLADTAIKAPYDGEVAERLKEPGERVAPGEPVLRIQDNQGFEMVIKAPDSVVSRLEVGSEHTVTLVARPETPLIGVVTEIGSDTDRSNSFEVVLALSGATDDLRSGLTGEAMIRLPTMTLSSAASMVAIPVTAFLAGPGDATFAFVIDRSSGTVHRRAITLADLVGETALVSDGLVPGDLVVTKGLPFLRDGQRVELLGEGPARYLAENRR